MAQKRRGAKIQGKCRRSKLQNSIDYWDEVELLYDIEFEKAYDNIKNACNDDVILVKECSSIAKEKLYDLALKIQKSTHITFWDKWGAGYE